MAIREALVISRNDVAYIVGHAAGYVAGRGYGLEASVMVFEAIAGLFDEVEGEGGADVVALFPNHD